MARRGTDRATLWTASDVRAVPCTWRVELCNLDECQTSSRQRDHLHCGAVLAMYERFCTIVRQLQLAYSRVGLQFS